MSKRWIVRWIIFASCGLLFVTCWLTWFVLQRGHVGPPTISKQTTYVDGPVEDNGYVDYFAAYNSLNSEGVTPEDNAAIQIVAALGPMELEPGEFESTWKFITRGSREPMPLPSGPFFKPFEKFEPRPQPLPKPSLEPKKPSADDDTAAKQESDVTTDGESEVGSPGKERKKISFQEQLKRAMRAQGGGPFEPYIEPIDYLSIIVEQPWSEKKYPFALEWLKANKKVIELVIAASKKPRYFLPTKRIDHNSSLFSCDIHYSRELSVIRDLLVAKSMWLIERGEIAACQDHLIALRRLAQLVQQSGSINETLISARIHRFALDAEMVMFEHGELDAALIQRYQKLLESVPPLMNSVEQVNRFERIGLLSLVQKIHQNGRDILELDTPSFSANSFDINLAMQICNDKFDRVIEILSIEDFNERLDSLEALYADSSDRVLNEDMDLKWDWKLKRWLGRKATSSVLAEFLFELLFYEPQMLETIFLGSQSHIRLIKVSLEIERFHLQNGSYPEKLDELAGCELAKSDPDWNIDPYTGQALIYKKGKTGFLLYSLGRDRMDQGGVAPEDAEGIMFDEIFKKDYVPAADD